MRFFAWLLNLFRGPRPIVRDVSRLETEEGDLGSLKEVVDVSGGPLKPHHRRRALRDPRLLPKPKPSGFFPRRRKKFMDADEATRLFAGTLRTRNRNLRDLLPDEEQLRRLGLPIWKTEQELAEALELSIKELRFYSIHRQAEKVTHYVTFSRPKRSGGARLIMAPKRRLKAIQRKLVEQLVRLLPVHSHAHGFRRSRSIRTAAEPHVGKAVLLRLDLKDFFPTVTFARVRGLLIAYGYGYEVASVLAVLMTEAPRQPVDMDGTIFHVPAGPRYCVQGAPTSPGLCNALVLRLDRRLAGLARKLGFDYTRYADDLAFSGNQLERIQKLRHLAMQIIREEGFVVNRAKTRIARKNARQAVAGVVVNDRLGLSRRERRRLRALIHRHVKDQAGGNVDAARLARIRGKLAYLNMLNPRQADALRTRLANP